MSGPANGKPFPMDRWFNDHLQWIYPRPNLKKTMYQNRNFIQRCHWHSILHARNLFSSCVYYRVPFYKERKAKAKAVVQCTKTVHLEKWGGKRAYNHKTNWKYKCWAGNVPMKPKHASTCHTSVKTPLSGMLLTACFFQAVKPNHKKQVSDVFSAQAGTTHCHQEKGDAGGDAPSVPKSTHARSHCRRSKRLAKQEIRLTP